MHGYSVSRETFTPDMAASVLENAGPNRKVSSQLVRSYVYSMGAGLWHDNGEPIRFDKNGKLIDGQHRLTAVSLLGSPRDFSVVRGLDPETINTIDTGRRKSANDVASIRGIKQAVSAVASARKVMEFDAIGVERWCRSFDLHTIAHLPPQAYVDFYEDNSPRIRESVLVGKAINQAIGATQSSVAACDFILSRINERAGVEFFSQLLSGEGLYRGNPVLCCRNFLTRLRGAKSTHKSPTALRAAERSAIIQCWNDWRLGNQRKTIRPDTKIETIQR